MKQKIKTTVSIKHTGVSYIIIIESKERMVYVEVGKREAYRVAFLLGITVIDEWVKIS